MGKVIFSQLFVNRGGVPLVLSLFLPGGGGVSPGPLSGAAWGRGTGRELAPGLVQESGPLDRTRG